MSNELKKLVDRDPFLRDNVKTAVLVFENLESAFFMQYRGAVRYRPIPMLSGVSVVSIC